MRWILNTFQREARAAAIEAQQLAAWCEARRRAWIEGRLAELRRQLVDGLYNSRQPDPNTEILALERELKLLQPRGE
jgi:hypothetical protein